MDGGTSETSTLEDTNQTALHIVCEDADFTNCLLDSGGFLQQVVQKVICSIRRRQLMQLWNENTMVSTSAVGC